MKRVLLALLASAALSVSAAGAQQSQTSPAAPPSPEAPEDNVVKRQETVNVTASRVPSAVINSPVAIHVITAETIGERGGCGPAPARPRRGWRCTGRLGRVATPVQRLAL